jgi:hypothetical protein
MCVQIHMANHEVESMIEAGLVAVEQHLRDVQMSLEEGSLDAAGACASTAADVVVALQSMMHGLRFHGAPAVSEATDDMAALMAASGVKLKESALS